MTFLAALGVTYLVFSLFVGVLLTLATWEKSNTFGFFAFVFCALGFAVVWPVIILATIGK